MAALLVLVGNGYCFVIEGDSAIEESNGVIITVSPHTASSPVKKYKQVFSFENKLAEDLTGMRVVFLFSDQPKITMQKWSAPSYETVEYSKAFDTMQYQWKYNELDSIATVYYVSDSNGFAENVVVWEHEVKSFSECAEGICFYWDNERIASGNKWENFDALHSLGEVEVNGQSVWHYYADEFDLAAGQKTEWKIKYSASKDSGKWTLALVKGSGDCLVNGTCEKRWVLDPWWGGDDWDSKYAIDDLVIGSALEAGDFIRIDHIDFSAMSIQCADLSDLRIVDESGEIELKRDVFGTSSSTDGNAVFELANPIAAGTHDGIFYIYTNNDACPAATRLDVIEDFEDVSDWTDILNNGTRTIQDTISISGNAVEDSYTGGTMWLYSHKAFNVEEYGIYVRTSRTDISAAARVDIFNGDLTKILSIEMSDGTFLTHADQSGADTTVAYAADTWYWFGFKRNGDNDVDLRIYNEAKTELLFSQLGVETAYGAGTPWEVGDSRVFTVSRDQGSDNSKSYYDELTAKGTVTAASSYSLGSEEIYDSDGDGVRDNSDECLGTPQGEAVDEVGCSCSQKVCDDGKPCTDDICDWNSAECVFQNDNTNECGFPRDCPDSTCILREEPPYFYWKLFPVDSQDYCLEGSCLQYSCDLISDDFNSECSFSNTTELEAKVEELEGKVTQLEEQNLELWGKIGLIEAGLNALQQTFENFISLVDAYLFNLPYGLRQGMLCGALEQSGETSGEGFGLHCEINDKGKCRCSGKKKSKK